MAASATLDTGRASHVDRVFKVKTHLPEDVLLFRRMTGTEQLGRLFEYELEMLSEDPDLQLPQMLGEKLTVTMDMSGEGGDKRYYTGLPNIHGRNAEHVPE